MSGSPLTPLSANAHKKQPPTLSPSRLPQKSGMTQPSKLKRGQATASSPFTSFSPAMAGSAKASRTASPTKSDLDGDVNLFHEGIGDDSVCSNFSDITVGQYGTASQGLDRLMSDAPSTPKRSPIKSSLSRPQTPITSQRQPKSTTTTPRTIRKAQRSTNTKSPSPPSSPETSPQADQTVNLLDFTQQFEAVTRPKGHEAFHRRAKSASPTKGSPSKVALPPSTPTESRFFNLLDLSPGPTMTPRSIPSITPREVEDLKAGYNSQISQLKAQLSGRDVEVSGLHTAIQETEERCAQLTHTIKEQQNKFEEERKNWNKVRAELGELFEAEKVEKESISTILEEKERVVSNLHVELEKKNVEYKSTKKRLREAEDELDRSRAEVVKAREEAATATTAAPPANGNSNAQAEVERVARELHTLYKAKHETKVAALKKSYEGRWEKKVVSLQEELAAVKKKNEELGRELEEKKAEELTADMSFTGPAGPATDDDLRRQVAELTKSLEIERQEKESIVSLVEELLAIQASAPPDQVEEKMRGSVRRASGVHAFRSTGGGSSGLRSGIERMGKTSSAATAAAAAARKD